MLEGHQVIKTRFLEDPVGDLPFPAFIKFFFQQQVGGFIQGPTWGPGGIKTFDTIEVETSSAGEEIGKLAAADLEICLLIRGVNGRLPGSNPFGFNKFPFRVSFEVNQSWGQAVRWTI